MYSSSGRFSAFCAHFCRPTATDRNVYVRSRNKNSASQIHNGSVRNAAGVSGAGLWAVELAGPTHRRIPNTRGAEPDSSRRSEEHTSELQSHLNLVCRLLLEKKKKIQISKMTNRSCWL